MIGYIYKTTNLINGKIYIGQHMGRKFDKYYYGSGIVIKRAIKKYGRENFKVKILYRAKIYKRLSEAEIIFIDIYNSTNPKIGYNRTLGGEGGTLGRRHTEKEKIKVSNSLKGHFVSEETRIKLSKSQKGIIRSKEFCDKVGNYWRGSVQSKSTANKRRKALKKTYAREDKREEIRTRMRAFWANPENRIRMGTVIKEGRAKSKEDRFKAAFVNDEYKEGWKIIKVNRNSKH